MKISEIRKISFSITGLE